MHQREIQRLPATRWQPAGHSSSLVAVAPYSSASEMRKLPDAQWRRRVQPDTVTDKETERAELDTLRSEWREALFAAREALRAEVGVLPPEELDAHERHLRDEYKTVAAGLRQFARDEGLPAELAELFLPPSPRPGDHSGFPQRCARVSSSWTTCSSAVPARTHALTNGRWRP